MPSRATTLVLAFMLAVSLGNRGPTAHAASRADQLKACAQEWQARKRTHGAAGVRYQIFIKDCLKGGLGKARTG